MARRVASIFRPDLFEGKVAIVTGGGSGIGRVIAQELASLECQVVIASRKPDRLQATAKELNEQLGKSRVTWMPCNIRDEANVKSLMEGVVKQFGRLDFVVNNGGGQFPSPAEAISTKGWQAVIETNLTGTFLCCREAFAAYMGKHGGSIVSIVADMWNGFPGMSHTGAARAGVENLTKTLAVEWAPHGIRVNAVAPGVIYSDTAAANYADPQLLQSYIPHVPAKRLGTPEEVSASVLFLLSPAAAYVTGETMRVDGASSIYKGSWPIAPHNNNEPYGELPASCRSKL